MTDRLDNWIQTGPGGGGRTMWCRMSPHDPEALISTGDMGGVFHSASGGADWRFLPSREIEYVAFDNGFDPWEFIPSRPGEVWTGSRTRGLLRSRNSGADWESVPGPWDELTRCDFSHWVGPDIVRFSPDGQRALAGWSACGDASRRVLMRSSDAGEHWEEIAPGLSSGPVKAIHFLSDELALILTGTESYCCYLVPGALERTAVHWEGTIFASADTRTSILAVTRDGSGRTRLYRIGEDLSFRQLPACVDGIELSIFVVGASFSADRVIYLGAFEAKDASGNLLLPATLWKSEDGGASWRNTLERRVDRTLNIDRKHWTTGEWGWDTAPQSVCVDTGNPDLVTFTDPTMCGYSRNGGRDWEIVTSLPMTAGRATPGGGMPMLTGWNYYVRGMEHILAVTDFAGWFSRDGGESWRFSPPADTPWHNNIYAIAFDPDDRRHWWAAVSLKHDLPYWHMMIHQDEEPTLWRGGVIETRDGGESWSVIAPEDGTIPDLPVTDILYDERRDCLWIAVLGSGIFRGDRRGGRWSRVSTGLPEENRNAFRLVLSPAGELYTVIIPRWLRESRTVEAGSCFRFDGSLGKWDRLPLPPELAYPVHLTFSADGTRMYLACFEFEREVPPPPGSDYPPPGLWAAAADGTGAEKLFTGFPVYMASEVPDRPEHIVMAGVGNGLHISRDSGRSWEPVKECPPGNVHSITFDPAEAGTVYLTTFGEGIWKGSL